MENNIKDSVSFWKNLILVFSFFTLTPLILGVSLFSLISLSSYSKIANSKVLGTASTLSSSSGLKVFASLPVNIPAIGGSVESGDARPEIIRQYLTIYNSPLVPFADFIVITADKYGLDFRLVTAIAQQESNLCKIIPPESYNCWGWGIHSKGSLGFTSYEEGIETVTAGLRKEYLDKGYDTVEAIMGKYTPLSNGSWAKGVGQFMAEME
jgi:hypothetical protein